MVCYLLDQLDDLHMYIIVTRIFSRKYIFLGGIMAKHLCFRLLLFMKLFSSTLGSEGLQILYFLFLFHLQLSFEMITEYVYTNHSILIVI